MPAAPVGSTPCIRQAYAHPKISPAVAAVLLRPQLDHQALMCPAAACVFQQLFEGSPVTDST
jgi:hypothetical protein